MAKVPVPVAENRLENQQLNGSKHGFFHSGFTKLIDSSTTWSKWRRAQECECRRIWNCHLWYKHEGSKSVQLLSIWTQTLSLNCHLVRGIKFKIHFFQTFVDVLISRKCVTRKWYHARILARGPGLCFLFCHKKSRKFIVWVFNNAGTCSLMFWDAEIKRATSTRLDISRKVCSSTLFTYQRVFKFSRRPAEVTGYFKHLRRVLFVFQILLTTQFCFTKS